MTYQGKIIYGMVCPKDSEGAGSVVSQWVLPKNSSAADPVRSFIKTNRMAIQEGYITAKGLREFAQAHPELKFKHETPQKRSLKALKPPTSGPFGIKSVGESENIRDIIEGKHNKFMGEPDTDYPDISKMTGICKLPKPRATKASRLQSKTKVGNVADASVALFKMKRFLNVPSKIQLGNKQAATA